MEEALSIRAGRTRVQYLATEYTLIDALLGHQTGCKTSGIALLGFYEALRRFINRKKHARENEVNYTQSYLKKRMGISNDLYYSCLKFLFSVTLLDLEKTLHVQFYFNGGEQGVLLHEDILIFSSLESCRQDYAMGQLQELIERRNGYMPGTVRVVSAVLRTSLVLHEYPQDQALRQGALTAIRDWDQEMPVVRKKNATPVSDCRNEGVSDSRKPQSSVPQKTGASDDRKLNTLNQTLKYSEFNQNNLKLQDEDDDVLRRINRNACLWALSEDKQRFASAVVSGLLSGQARYHHVLNSQGNTAADTLNDLSYGAVLLAFNRLDDALRDKSVISPEGYFASCLFSAIRELPLVVKKLETRIKTAPAGENLQLHCDLSQYTESPEAQLTSEIRLLEPHAESITRTSLSAWTVRWKRGGATLVFWDTECGMVSTKELSAV